jgi:hypothetical protein
MGKDTDTAPVAVEEVDLPAVAEKIAVAVAAVGHERPAVVPGQPEPPPYSCVCKVLS